MPYMGYEDLNKSTKIGIKGIIALAKDNGFDFERVDNGVKLIDPNGRDQTFTAKTTAGAVGKWMGYNTGGMVQGKQGYFLGGILSALAGKALLPKILGGIAGTVVLDKLFGSKSGTNKESVEEALARFNAAPKTTDPLKNLFKSKYTTVDKDGNEMSPHFDTAEARDAYDDKIEKDYLNQPITQLYSGMAGLIQGPGTVNSDSIPGGIMQNGQKVEEILVSNGEVILSGKDLAGLDPDGNMERAGQRLGNAPNGSRGAEAARMFAEVNKA